MKNPLLVRNSMELIKDITQMLREIIASGDEERLRQLRQVIEALNDSALESRLLH